MKISQDQKTKKDSLDHKVRTRFAPSPTGSVHVGNVYGAMLDYAFAKKNGGGFILRIEDTDQKRKVKGAEEKIYRGLRWVGIEPDESPKHGGSFGPYRQSERLDIYKKYAQQLVDQGDAYYCFCTSERLKKLREEQKKKRQSPRYDRYCRELSKDQVNKKIAAGEKHVIRMKIPDNKKIVVNDLIRGEVIFESSLQDDQVLLKADGFPTYHLAVVVDDHLMEISHIVRGEEWLSSAPKHVLLYDYFGWEMPLVVHTANLRNPDRSKMSKRHGHTSLDWYIEQGFLPEAILNYFGLLGWSHPEEKELFSLGEFIKLFDLKDLSPIGPVFDIKKLEWINGLYIRQKKDDDLVKNLKPFLPKMSEGQILKIIPLIKERIKKLSEATVMLEFIWTQVDYQKDLLTPGETTADLSLEMLRSARKVVEQTGVNKTEELKQKFLSLIKENSWSTGKFFMVFRVAICGKKITPPIVESLPFLTKKEVLDRIDLAVNKLL